MHRVIETAAEWFLCVWLIAVLAMFCMTDVPEGIKLFETILGTPFILASAPD